MHQKAGVPTNNPQGTKKNKTQQIGKVKSACVQKMLLSPVNPFEKNLQKPFFAKCKIWHKEAVQNKNRKNCFAKYDVTM